ncbi:MAG: branched-chain amino acid ABC transporter permease [Bacillota bacterium]
MVVQQIANGLVLGSLYALVALGLTLVYGVLRILHVAHAGVFVLGAYVGVLVYLPTGSLALAIVSAAVVCSLAGLIMYRFLYRPVLGRPPLVPLIISIGAFMFLEDLYRLVMGPYIKSLPVTIRAAGFETAAVRLTGYQLFIVAAAAGLLLGLWWLMRGTRLGLAWRASAQDLETAAAHGINTDVIIGVCFVIGSAIAAVAGVMVGGYYNQVYPSMGSVPAYKALAVIVLGGMGSVPGTVIAGLALGLAETLTMVWVGTFLPRDAIAFLVLILMLLVKPTGLLGRAS